MNIVNNIFSFFLIVFFLFNSFEILGNIASFVLYISFVILFFMIMFLSRPALFRNTIETQSFSPFLPFLSRILSLLSQQFCSRLVRIFSNNLLFVIAELSRWIFRIALFAGCKTLRSCDGCPAKLCNFLTEREACSLSFSVHALAWPQSFSSPATSVSNDKFYCKIIQLYVK